MEKFASCTIRNTDGSVELTTQSGIISAISDNDLVVDLPHIASVGIKNIAEVVEHLTASVLGSRSHMVRFVNGGVLEFAYSNTGELIELKATGLVTIIQPGNEVLFTLPADF